MDQSTNNNKAIVAQFVESTFLQSDSQDVEEVMSVIHKKRVNVSEKSLRRKKKSSTLRTCVLLPLQKAMYKNYMPLHELWKLYVSEVLISCSDTKAMQDILLKADLHGAMVRIVFSKCHSVSNLCGIIITESRNIFQIVTASNAIVKIPKKNTVFEIIFQKYRITIFGDQFRIKPGFRLAKKFAKYLSRLDMI